MKQLLILFMLLSRWVFETSDLIFTRKLVKIRPLASKTHLSRSMKNISNLFYHPYNSYFIVLVFQIHVHVAKEVKNAGLEICIQSVHEGLFECSSGHYGIFGFSTSPIVEWHLRLACINHVNINGNPGLPWASTQQWCNTWRKMRQGERHHV